MLCVDSCNVTALLASIITSHASYDLVQRIVCRSVRVSGDAVNIQTERQLPMLVGALWINAILNPLQQLAAKGSFMQQFSAAAAGGTLHSAKLHSANCCADRNCLQSSALKHLGLSSTLCSHAVGKAAVCRRFPPI
jgi:hypothetical protein